MKRVLIADNHPMMRDAVRNLLTGSDAFEVVGDVGDTESCLFQIEQCNPDILALDLNMPSEGGFRLMERLQALNISLEIFIFSMHSGPEFVARARKLGARGFVAKEDVGHEFLSMLQSKSDGFLMSSSAGRDQSPASFMQDLVSTDVQTQLATLPHAELLVLRHLCHSRTSTEISAELGVSTRTIHAHRHNMCQKLGLTGANKLMAFAIENKSAITATQ
jgi:DNA-binding NarL/FixJ family response regulator